LCENLKKIQELLNTEQENAKMLEMYQSEENKKLLNKEKQQITKLKKLNDFLGNLKNIILDGLKESTGNAQEIKKLLEQDSCSELSIKLNDPNSTYLEAIKKALDNFKIMKNIFTLFKEIPDRLNITIADEHIDNINEYLTEEEEEEKKEQTSNEDENNPSSGKKRPQQQQQQTQKKK